MQDPGSRGTITLISQLYKLTHRRTTEELLGMRWRHFIVLSTLADRSPMQQQSLCEAIVMDSNNCVLLLNELESLGYIKRTRDPADRRRHLVEVTEVGIDAYERGQIARESLEDEVLRSLDPGERQSLHHLLVKALGG